MSANTIPNCPLALPVETLSAWRDGALAPEEAHDIERHVADCDACRARLADYDAIAAALAAIRVPAPAGGYRQNPRTSGRAARVTARPVTHTRLRIAGGLGALAAVLLLALAFAQVFSAFGGRGRLPGTGGTPVATPAATATATSTQPLPPVQGVPLAWQARAALPAGIHPYPTGFPGRGGQNFALAASNGTSAYACDVTPSPSSGPLPTDAVTHVWATHDAGAHWTEALDIADQSDATSCTVSVDAYDPAMVLASSSWAFRTAPPAPNQSANYVSYDGGDTWQRLPGNQLILQPATMRSDPQNSTYAIHETQPGTGINSPLSMDFAVSRDGLRTWTPIDADILHATPQQTLLRFWLNPGDGALLVETQEAETENLRLWTSADGGAHWSELAQTISQATMLGDFVVQTSSAGAAVPWSICAATNPVGAHSTALTCSVDGGRTWTQRPSLTLPPSESSGSAQGASGPIEQVIAIASDGAVLETWPDRQHGETLYRLPEGASRWESLGSVPQTSVYYLPGPGGGLLWALPSPDSSDTSTGVYTAAYS